MVSFSATSLILFLFGLAATTEAVTYLDRKCGNDLENLWLDVIVLVDNSNKVTQLPQVTQNILSVFGTGTRIGTSESEPKTTRFSLITFNKDASIIADLNVYESYTALSSSVPAALASLSPFEESYLTKGLQQAEVVLERSINATERMQYKRVLLIYTSSFNNGSDAFLARLRADGIETIIVDGLSTSSGGVDSSTISIHDAGLTRTIQEALLQANCYCPNGWTQLRESHTDIHSYRYGMCLKFDSLEASWLAAHISCQNQFRNAHLSTEFEVNKHNYILETMKNTSTFVPPYIYHIGLSYSNGGWYWDQPVGKSPINLNLQNWTNWNPGYPVISSTQVAVLNMQNPDGTTGWQNVPRYSQSARYVCEVVACDTDTYCELQEI